MKHSRFVALSSSLFDLSRAQIDKVRKELQALSSALDSSLALAGKDPISCRHCLCTSLVRFCFQNGIQRFRCKACSKTCRATTGAPVRQASARGLRRMHGQRLHASANRIGLEDDSRPAFRWRHRMLKEPIGHQPKAVKGILGVDETHFKISCKGQRDLGPAARKRGGRAGHNGRFSSDFMPVLVGRVRGQPYTLDKAMASMAKTGDPRSPAGCVDPATTVMCMDSHRSFLEMRKMLGVATNIFVTTKAKPANFHVQNVNSYHERLKTWIDYRLRGVASKYMPSYLAWQRLRTWKEMSSAELISYALGRQIISW